MDSSVTLDKMQTSGNVTVPRFNHTLSIVVPVYNSKGTLSELLSQIRAACEGLVPDFEVVCVDDGSRDGSAEELQRLAAIHPFLRVVCMARNFGQHNALVCGIRHASFEVVVTMDDDLQHPPSEICKLLARMEEGYDMVYGAPKVEKQAAWRLLPSLAPKWIQARVLGVPRATDISAFRAFRTSIREAFADYNGASPILDVLLSWGTRSFGAVEVEHRPRQTGRSNYNVGKLYQAAWLMMTEFSLIPLRIVMVVGVCGAVVGVMLFAYAVFTYFFRGSLPGFPFLASIISLFSAATLLSLGTLGEYLGRIHLRLSGKPTYVTVKNDFETPTSEKQNP